MDEPIALREDDTSTWFEHASDLGQHFSWSGQVVYGNNTRDHVERLIWVREQRIRVQILHNIACTVAPIAIKQMTEQTQLNNTWH
jgi:hypothetical protein